jgi:hypothetical protein
VQRRDGLEGEIVAKAKVRNVAVTNCFPGDVLVCGAAEGISRRLYSGPMVEIHLASGEKLTGTPNHPIFTQRGWVPLGELVEGQDRIGRRLSDLVMPAVAHDVQDVPTSLEQIFDLARLSGSPLGVRPSGKVDFHGDGLGSDIDVVPFDGPLRRCFDAAFAQKFGESVLSTADVELRTFPGLRPSEQGSVAVFHAPASFVGGASQLLSLGGGAESIAPELFFVPVTGDACATGDVEHGYAGDPVTGRDAGRALSPAIGFSELRSKRSFEWSGHVFNLQTRHGWYAAGNIISSNCPVNTDTQLEVIAKSLMAMEGADPSMDDIRRALAAGAAISAPGTWAPGNGFALRPESMETTRDVHRALRRKKRISKAEAVEIVKGRYPGITDSQAMRIVEHAARSR